MTLIFILTKEELRRSGFVAIAAYPDEEEWWNRVPPVIEVLVNPEWEVVRYCFDFDQDGVFKGRHEDDYYEHGREPVKVALEVARKLGKRLEEVESA